MRANKFTFKKTKRVKTVTVHKGISIDLTIQEAEDLAELLSWRRSNGGWNVGVSILLGSLVPALDKLIEESK